MTSMRRRTSSGNPRGRVPGLALTPARERGFVVFAFAFNDGFGDARTGFFTGEGSGWYPQRSNGRMIESTKEMVAPCPSWQPPRLPICSSLCSPSHCGYST
jgi:hypothetical protein